MLTPFSTYRLHMIHKIHSTSTISTNISINITRRRCMWLNCRTYDGILHKPQRTAYYSYWFILNPMDMLSHHCLSGILFSLFMYSESTVWALFEPSYQIACKYSKFPVWFVSRKYCVERRIQTNNYSQDIQDLYKKFDDFDLTSRFYFHAAQL